MNKIIEKISIWTLTIIIISIFFGGIIYSANQMKGITSTSEIFFWSSLVLLFMLQINRGLSGLFANREKPVVEESP